MRIELNWRKPLFYLLLPVLLFLCFVGFPPPFPPPPGRRAEQQQCEPVEREVKQRRG